MRNKKPRDPGGVEEGWEGGARERQGIPDSQEGLESGQEEVGEGGDEKHSEGGVGGEEKVGEGGGESGEEEVGVGLQVGEREVQKQKVMCGGWSEKGQLVGEKGIGARLPKKGVERDRVR